MKKIQENIPVVIIHKGLHRYVQVAINQAKFFANDVSVISDKSFKNCLNYDIDKYSKQAFTFCKILCIKFLNLLFRFQNFERQFIRFFQMLLLCFPFLIKK